MTGVIAAVLTAICSLVLCLRSPKSSMIAMLVVFSLLACTPIFAADNAPTPDGMHQSLPQATTYLHRYRHVERHWAFVAYEGEKVTKKPTVDLSSLTDPACKECKDGCKPGETCKVGPDGKCVCTATPNNACVKGPDGKWVCPQQNQAANTTSRTTVVMRRGYGGFLRRWRGR